jgi:hypothetical protein
MEQQNYQQYIANVRAILADRLGANPGNPESFGNGEFYISAEYGDRGDKGDVVLYVSRNDNRMRRRLTLEWRSFTPERTAEALLQAYEYLSPKSVIKRIEAAVVSMLPAVNVQESEGATTFFFDGRTVFLGDVPHVHGRILVSGPKQAPPLAVDLNMRFDSEAVERGARLIAERLTSPYYGL